MGYGWLCGVNYIVYSALLLLLVYMALFSLNGCAILPNTPKRVCGRAKDKTISGCFFEPFNYLDAFSLETALSGRLKQDGQDNCFSPTGRKPHSVGFPGLSYQRGFLLIRFQKQREFGILTRH